MTEDQILNPFIVGKYVSERYFCDRVEETAFLMKQIENGRNVAMISPRRMGKSDLIHHFFNSQEIKERYHVFFVDIYATTSLSEFVYTLGKVIYDQLKPKSTVWKEKFFQVITSLRMGFKLDGMTGAPTFDLGLGDIQSPQTTLDEIFAYIEEADKPCIIAIDEFQQIGAYSEQNVEALLRTKIQRCLRAQFIFSGSKRHTMSNMFNSSSKPFYQSAISMGLEPIPLEHYNEFAVRLFEEKGKHLESEVVKMVWQQYNGFTWFVQMMMNELYALTPFGGICRLDMIAEAKNYVILSQENSYKDMLANLPAQQKVILQAIAKEGIAANVTSSAFIKKYNISSASSVQAAIKGLLKNDVITKEGDTYRVYDFFFSEWLASVF